ncbi:unnamed protein product [Pleuronectes platessa]|uniref:Uncharacterized protein n=1 Tax=Pleuronectes platessa TaxID=8262 RepID=A0A9N7VUR7_PLEPL|nr:unnamed protein product [Pleuronectes platessa]
MGELGGKAALAAQIMEHCKPPGWRAGSRSRGVVRRRGEGVLERRKKIEEQEEDGMRQATQAAKGMGAAVMETGSCGELRAQREVEVNMGSLGFCSSLGPHEIGMYHIIVGTGG